MLLFFVCSFLSCCLCNDSLQKIVIVERQRGRSNTPQRRTRKRDWETLSVFSCMSVQVVHLSTTASNAHKCSHFAASQMPPQTAKPIAPTTFLGRFHSHCTLLSMMGEWIPYNMSECWIPTSLNCMYCTHAGTAHILLFRVFVYRSGSCAMHVLLQCVVCTVVPVVSTASGCGSKNQRGASE